MILKPPHPFHLRAMISADIEAVMEIEMASFPSSWSAAGYRHELTANQQAHYVVLESENAQAESERIMIGYAGHWIVAGEAHISTIAVAPQWRGRGLGALLLLSVIYHALAQEAGVVSLEVREGNEPAQRLYTDYGFVMVGRRRRYYRDTGEDALLMDLSLAETGVIDRLEARRKVLWERLQATSA